MGIFRRSSRRRNKVVTHDFHVAADDMARSESFYDFKRRQQLIEWRQRQAYFEKYGTAPAPSIIRPGQDSVMH